MGLFVLVSLLWVEGRDWLKLFHLYTVKTSSLQILFVVIIINGDDFGGVGCLLREKEASRLVATFQQVHDARLPYTPTT